MFFRFEEGPFKAGVIYFALVFGAGFVLGTIRTLWVIPGVGTMTAEVMEMPIITGGHHCGGSLDSSVPVGSDDVVCPNRDVLHRISARAHRGVWVRAVDSGLLDKRLSCYPRPRGGSSLLPRESPLYVSKCSRHDLPPPASR
jgi:hypothetical protein